MFCSLSDLQGTIGGEQQRDSNLDHRLTQLMGGVECLGQDSSVISERQKIIGKFGGIWVGVPNPNCPSADI